MTSLLASRVLQDVARMAGLDLYVHKPLANRRAIILQ